MTPSTKARLTLVPRPSHTTLTVVFGPARSQFFPRTLAHAQAAGAELTELTPGRLRATFMLRADPAVFAHVGALCRLVRNWRGTEMTADGLPVSGALVQEMGSCAAGQLVRNGACREPFHGVAARCGPCPLVDPGRTLRDLPRRQAGDRPESRSASTARIRRSASRGTGGPALRLVKEGDPPPRLATRFTVLFGPSRALDFPRALARAEDGASALSELPDGSCLAEFVLALDPGPYLALEGFLRLLLSLRGAEVTKDGFPVPLGRALATARRERRLLRPTYVVPPPRDLVSLLVDDLTDGPGDAADLSGPPWTEPRHWGHDPDSPQSLAGVSLPCSSWRPADGRGPSVSHRS